MINFRLSLLSMSIVAAFAYNPAYAVNSYTIPSSLGIHEDDTPYVDDRTPNTESVDFPTASASQSIYSNGKNIFNIHFFGQGSEIKDFNSPNSPPEYSSTYDLSDNQKQGILSGTQYWADILGKGFKQPVNFFVYTYNANNADATFYSYKDNQLHQLAGWFSRAASGKETVGAHDGGYIRIGKFKVNNSTEAPPSMDFEHALPTHEWNAIPLTSVMFHEIGHALGIASSENPICTNDNRIVDCSDNLPPLISNDNQITQLTSTNNTVTDGVLDNYTNNLYDSTGKRAKVGMYVVPYAALKNFQEDYDVPDEDIFVVADPDENEISGRSYFSATHVQEVLNGATLEYGSGKVPGIPIGWSEGYGEISHLQTRNGMMSHWNYRNYTSFMEVEYALLQDLGYTIDRRNWFGYSIYGDDQTLENTNGYFLRNAEGAAYIPGQYNPTQLGVGLHIYGSRNTVTQKADILSSGVGGTGIRVDGLEGNKLTIAKGIKVHADGKNGNGLLVSYGKNHVINHQGDIRARGENGVGARFDFGDNLFPNTWEYRGSYIWIVGGKNTDLDTTALSSTGLRLEELQGPLVKRFDIAGHLEGAQQAIYIAPNAYVEQINVLDGAEIIGDIQSDWRHFDVILPKDETMPDGVTIQAPEGTPAESLNTQLNFKSNLVYRGNITGTDNIQMNIMGADDGTSRTLAYRGHAKVLGVNVAPNGVLLGGEYTLSSREFINRGSIGGSTDGTPLVIHQGDLESTGATLLYTASNPTEAAQIQVPNGVANIDNTTVVMTARDVYQPLADYKVLSAQTVNGAPTSFRAEGLVDNKTGLLTGQLFSNATGSFIRFTPSNNLGIMTRPQHTVLHHIEEVFNQDTASLFAPLYSLSATKAKTALTDLYGGLRSDMGNMIKQDRFTIDTMQSRLDTIDTPRGAWATIDYKNGSLNRKQDLTKVDTDSYHLGVGADHQLSDNWLVGGMFSYGHHKLTDNAATGKIDDWRLNVYTRYGKPQQLNWDMYLGYGWQSHSVKRGASYLDDRISGDYHSQLLSAGTRLSKLFSLGNPEAGWGLRPYVGVDVARYHQNGYHEKGTTPYAQSVDSLNDTAFTASIGTKLTKTFKDKGSVGIEIAYRRLLKGKNTPLQTAFDAGQSYRTKGHGWAKDVVAVNLQGSVNLKQNLSLQGQVSSEFGKGLRQYGGQVNVIWKF